MREVELDDAIKECAIFTEKSPDTGELWRLFNAAFVDAARTSLSIARLIWCDGSSMYRLRKPSTKLNSTPQQYSAQSACDLYSESCTRLHSIRKKIVALFGAVEPLLSKVHDEIYFSLEELRTISYILPNAIAWICILNAAWFRVLPKRGKKKSPAEVFENAVKGVSSELASGLKRMHAMLLKIAAHFVCPLDNEGDTTVHAIVCKIRQSHAKSCQNLAVVVATLISFLKNSCK